MKVLKIGALWCPGCLVMKPRWQAIEKELPELETIYFDYDEDKEMVGKWDVGDNLPVFIFLDKNNKELERLVGEPSVKEIMNLIEKYKNQ